MYDNFIFDLYGTLVDIRTNEEKSHLWKKMSEIYSSMGAVYSPGELKKEFRRLELRQKEILCAKEKQDFVEPDLTAVFTKLYTNRGIDCGEQQVKMTAVTFRTLSRQKLMVYDGVKKTLTKLRKRRKGVYLLSNAQRDFTRPELELLGLTEYFDGILISSEEGCKKPSPDFFHRIIKRYGLQVEKCLMVGNDETSDILGARSVGMDSLYVQTETSPRLKGTSSATYCVSDGDWGKVSEILLKFSEA